MGEDSYGVASSTDATSYSYDYAAATEVDYSSMTTVETVSVDTFAVGSGGFGHTGGGSGAAGMLRLGMNLLNNTLNSGGGAEGDGSDPTAGWGDAVSGVDTGGLVEGVTSGATDFVSGLFQ